MKKILFILLFISFTLNNVISQTNYYFSENGSSSGTGSISSPFRHPNNYDWSTAVNGDTYLFDRGSAWDSVVIRIYGVSNVTFTAYGGGIDPILSGDITLGGGVDNLDNTFTFSSALLPTGTHNKIIDYNYGVLYYSQTLSFLNINGSYYDIATEPDGYQIYYDTEDVGDDPSYNDWISETDQSYTTNELVGAILDIGAEAWSRIKIDITSNSTNTIYLESLDFSRNGGINLVKGSGIYDLKYKILNWNPDQYGEWVYDNSSKEITIYSTTSLLSETIKIPCYDSILCIENGTNCLVENISFSGAITAGIMVKGGSGNTIQNCKVENIGLFGIWGYSTTGLSILSDSIINIGNDGVHLTDCNSQSVISCRISKVGIQSLGSDRVEASNGIQDIRKGSGDSYFRLNYIDSTGYCGIRINYDVGSSDSTFANKNLFRYTNMETTDGAAIYVSSGADNSSIKTQVDSNLFSNIISNSARSYNGIDWFSMGIYVDTWGQYTTARHNYGTRTETAMFVNGCKYNVFSDNEFSLVGYTGFYGGETGHNVSTINTDFLRNDIICSDAVSYGFSWWQIGTFSLGGCNFDYNRYYNPFEDSDGSINKIYTTGETSLTTWRSETGEDYNTTYNEHGWTMSDVSISSELMVKPLWNFSSSTRIVDLYDVVYKDKDNVNHSGTWSIPPYSGVTGFYVSGTADSASMISEGNIDDISSEVSDTTFAIDTIQAENYDVEYGDVVIVSSDPIYTGYFQGYNDSIIFNDIYFNNENILMIKVSVPIGYENYVGYSVDGVKDSIYISNTGGWDGEYFTWYSISFPELTGYNDITLFSRRPNIDEFTFIRGTTYVSEDTLFCYNPDGEYNPFSYTPFHLTGCISDSLLRLGNSEYIYFTDVDFGGGVNTFDIVMGASQEATSYWAIILDNIANDPILTVSDYNAYFQCSLQTKAISTISGVHDVYIKNPSYSYSWFGWIYFYNSAHQINKLGNFTGINTGQWRAVVK